MKSEKTTTVESLLGVLSLGPKSGYEMRQMMERSTANFWSESFGQIYPALKSMVRDGLVTVEDKGVEARAKKVYRLTALGERRLRLWLGVEAKPQVFRNELLLKVYFGDKADRGVIAAHVVAERERCEEKLERYEGCAGKDGDAVCSASGDAVLEDDGAVRDSTGEGNDRVVR